MSSSSDGAAATASSTGATPRVKILALLIFLIAVATTHRDFELPGLFYFAVLVGGMIAARLPVIGVLRRAAIVLPFSLTLAAITWISGEPRRAAMVVEKSFLSASAALLLVATTPLPQLLRGLEMLGTPRFLLMVAQFVYRYLFVIAEQTHRMRLAALCRGGRFRRKAASAQRPERSASCSSAPTSAPIAFIGR